MTLVKHTAPYIKRPDSLNRMLLDVLIALAPTLIFAFVVFPLDALRLFGLSAVTMVLCEFLFVLMTKKTPRAFTLQNLLSALVSATIFALIMPTNPGWESGIGYWTVIASAAMGITLGKLVFGGTGNNIFNPAAIGRIIASLGWGGNFNSGSTESWFYSNSTFTGATALKTTGFADICNTNLVNLLLGDGHGALGEGFVITILIGLVFLLVRRAIDWRIVVSYVGTFVLLSLTVGLTYFIKLKTGNPINFLAFQVLSGGFLFGAVFMITDPVTSPAGSPARYIYGCFSALIAVLIRTFVGGEGVAFAILIANCFSPLLDYYQWSSPKWKKWHCITLGALLVLGLAVVIIGVSFGGGKLN